MFLDIELLFLLPNILYFISFILCLSSVLQVLRPFLLRRIKVDVEKQMPKKYEHVVHCRLSKRQRFLYDDFMAQAS